MLIYNTTLFETELKIKQKYYRRVNLEKSFKEKLVNYRRKHEIAYYCLFNDGSSVEDENWYAKDIKDNNTESATNSVKAAFEYSAETLALMCDYDYLEMGIKFGLVFEINDVDNQKHIKPNAKPVSNVVRFATKPVKSSFNGKATGMDKENEHLTFGGYVNYDEFISSLENLGVEFDGPKTYEEYLYTMIYGIPFNMTLSVDLKEEKKLTRK